MFPTNKIPLDPITPMYLLTLRRPPRQINQIFPTHFPLIPGNRSIESEHTRRSFNVRGPRRYFPLNIFVSCLTFVSLSVLASLVSLARDQRLRFVSISACLEANPDFSPKFQSKKSHRIITRGRGELPVEAPPPQSRFRQVPRDAKFLATPFRSVVPRSRYHSPSPPV